MDNLFDHSTNAKCAVDLWYKAIEISTSHKFIRIIFYQGCATYTTLRSHLNIFYSFPVYLQLFFNSFPQIDKDSF
jgi:hypothetical protein